MDYPTRYRGGHDAIRRMCDGATSPLKAQAMHLVESGYWPSLPQASLEARFRACLNPSKKDQLFRFSEIIALEQHTRRHDPLFFHCDALGYSRPVMKPAGATIAELAQEVRTLMAMTETLTRALQAEISRSIETPAALPANVLKFSRPEEMPCPEISSTSSASYPAVTSSPS